MILTIDLGTTLLKFGLFGRDGQAAALRSQPAPVRHPEPGRWEMAVEDFREAIARGIRGLREALPAGLADVQAVSVATQTNSFLLLGAGDEPLTPLILWPDARGADEAPVLGDPAAAEGLTARTGLPALSGEFVPAKLLHLRRRRPETWRRARRLCLIGEYLTLWLTGRHVGEAGCAGLTGLLDIHALAPFEPVCRMAGVDPDWLPPCARAGTVVGPVRDDPGRGWGLPPGCPLILAGLDQYAGAVGAGLGSAGPCAETTGTVLCTIRRADSFDANPARGVFQGPAAAPGAFYRFIFDRTGTGLLEWYRRRLADAPDCAALVAEAQAVPPGAGGLRAIPLTEGGRTGVRFEGPFDPSDRGRAVRAIMEAVAWALAGQVDALCGRERPTEVRSLGGAARSPVWLQIKADVLDLPVRAPACPEPTSLGAALLAGPALGWGTLEELTGRWVDWRPPMVPDAGRHAVYAGLRRNV